ncbi:hypothetical protein AYO45_01715 [Gammaproteobacteria bacterium SCGC AG-212-F23]|nr:hypothetical protein AYO45_01715 [Gammaproteobacteria bacterium SCGC AG-212-F23]
MKINNVEIFLEKVSGKGDLNFVLVHNAGGNHQFFSHQIYLLKKYGNIIWLDLPGHGDSDAMNHYEMHELSLTLKKICENLSLNKICLIGLNNGADIVIDAAITQNLPIHSIILIDPPLFMEPAFIDEIESFIQKLEQQDYDKFIISLVDNLFIKTDKGNKEIALKAFNSVDKKSLQSIFKGLIAWDANAIGKLKQIHYPALCILTDEHHCSYNKMRQEAPHFEIGKVIGSKCWATLEVPDQVNAMIERFLILNS